uniref:Putative transporter sll0355 n=1 Tax=Anthurium amnicola TaxID=1678845 RepID=A0A1D1XZR0_9ARAE
MSVNSTLPETGAVGEGRSRSEMATTAAVLLLLPNFLSSPSPPTPAFPGRTLLPHGSPPPSPWPQRRGVRARAVPAAITCCATPGSSGGSGKIQNRRATVMPEPQLDSPAVDCTGTGTDVECFFAESTSESDGLLQPGKVSSFEVEGGGDGAGSDGVLARGVFEWALLVSPFFFWGTAMVAMKGVIPKAGPFFVSAFRLVPAGLMLIGFAGIKGRKQPSGAAAWLSIFVFGIVDGACFQGFLAEGLQKTSAGLGSHCCLVNQSVWWELLGLFLVL